MATNEQIVEAIQKGAENRQDLLMELYEQNRGLIYKVISPYVQEGRTEIEDAMQEAFFGLCEAANRYNPELGSFSRYFPYWVRASVYRWQQNTGDLKRIPANMHELIFRYKRFCKDFRSVNGFQPSDKRCMRVLKITEEQYKKLQRYIYEQKTLSLSQVLPGTDDVTLEDSIPDVLSDVESDAIAVADQEIEHKIIWEEVDKLTDKQSEVLKHRYIEQKLMREVGEQMGISKEAVRVHEFNGLKKLRHNKTILRIAASYGITSKIYKGGLSRFKNSSSSVVEEIALRRLQKEDAIYRYLRMREESREMDDGDFDAKAGDKKDGRF